MVKSNHLATPANYAKLLRWAVILKKSDVTQDAIRARVTEQVFNFNHAVELDNVFLSSVADEVFNSVASNPKEFTEVSSKEI